MIVEKAAGGLANANVTVLNGSDGLSDVVSGLVGQGLAIFNSLRGEVAGDKEIDTKAIERGPGGTGSGDTSGKP